MPDLTDRRVQKTRQILQKAIMELIVTRGYQSITVQEILDKANVGRSTFYAHYQDKGELLHSCFEEFHKMMEDHVLFLANGMGGRSSPQFNPDFILKFLEFVEHNGPLMKALLVLDDISESIKKSLFESVYESFKKNPAGEKNHQIPLEVVAQYIVNAYFGTIKWWVAHDMPCTAVELDGYIKQLSMPTIKSLNLDPRRQA
jgi:AcrR family transcriptional regulator